MALGRTALGTRFGASADSAGPLKARAIPSSTATANRIGSDSASAQVKAAGAYPQGYYPHNIHFVLVSAQMAGAAEHVIWAAERLSKDFDFVRIDLYDAERPFFGEATFVPGSGFERFSDAAIEEELGGLWVLPGR